MTTLSGPGNRYKQVFRRLLAFNLIAIVATVLVSLPFDMVYRQFEDGGFITYFSVIQLFVLSYLAHRIFKIRAEGVAHPWRSPVAIWAYISLGFSFLALDDLLMIHEFIDQVIHHVGQIQETALTDRIDDLLVGFYGLVGIGMLVRYRSELKRYRKALIYVIAGFVCLFIMVGIDVVTNRDDILLLLFAPETVQSISQYIFVFEEGFKLISEAFFIVAAYICRETAQRHRHRQRSIAASPPQPAAVSNP